MHVYFLAISVGHLACHVPTFPNVFAMIGGPNVEWGLPGGGRLPGYTMWLIPRQTCSTTQPWTAERPLDGWELVWNWVSV